mgnify:CR=1 FL=1
MGYQVGFQCFDTLQEAQDYKYSSVAPVINQNNQLIQQNQRLIEQHEAKDEIILQSLQQNNELIAQMYEQEDEPEGSQYLDG